VVTEGFQKFAPGDAVKPMPAPTERADADSAFDVTASVQAR
jgi:hypothetical protein